MPPRSAACSRDAVASQGEALIPSKLCSGSRISLNSLAYCFVEDVHRTPGSASACFVPCSFYDKLVTQMRAMRVSLMHVCFFTAFCPGIILGVVPIVSCMCSVDYSVRLLDFSSAHKGDRQPMADRSVVSVISRYNL